MSDLKRAIDTEDGYDEYEESQPSAPKRSKNIIKVFHQIPENCVAIVIGRHGQGIKSISERSECSVQVEHIKSTTGSRTVEIMGSPDQVEVARLLIDDEVRRGLSKMHNNDGGRITGTVMIPANKCGMVIGKGGTMMRNLREWTECAIMLIQHSSSTTEIDAKPLKITGLPENVEKAKRIVENLLADNDYKIDAAPSYMPANSAAANTTILVKVPRSTVGAIMGLRGVNIRQMSEKTGVKIQFLPDDDPGLVERSIVLVGSRYKIDTAVQLLKDVIRANTVAGDDQPVSLFYLEIPASKAGLVIGRSGDTIKQINSASGAHCELSRTPEESPMVKTFVIRGTPLQIEHAKHLIYQKVGDVPPDVPFSLVKPPQQTQAQQPGYSGYPGYSNYSQPVNPGYSTLQQNPPIQPVNNNYLPPQVPIYPPPEQQNSKPVDFSSQWLDYYISIGDYSAAEAVRTKIMEDANSKPGY